MDNEHVSNLYGLLGKNISYSFSQGYFTKKFETLGLRKHKYINFDIQKIDDFASVLKDNPNLKGMNVTIPYKEEIIPFLDNLDRKAKHIGAVNTIKFTPDGLKGFNTDCYGFKNSLKPLLKSHHRKALILGTGGASKAVAYALDELGIGYKFVSRKPSDKKLSYDHLSKRIIKEHTLIINCTPLGTFPNVQNKPEIPYGHLNSEHLLYDLIYNPAETSFMKAGKYYGSKTCNGLRMLELQAEKAWKIWNK